MTSPREPRVCSMPAAPGLGAHPKSPWSSGDDVRENVARFPDHSSLAVTTTHLRRLEGQEDRGCGRVAEAIGV